MYNKNSFILAFCVFYFACVCNHMIRIFECVCLFNSFEIHNTYYTNEKRNNCIFNSYGNSKTHSLSRILNKTTHKKHLNILVRRHDAVVIRLYIINISNFIGHYLR